MKVRTMILLTVFWAAALAAAAHASVAIDQEHFPDAVFREYVASNYDMNGNGILEDGEISEAIEMTVDDMDIHSLKGLEYLDRLEYLDANRIHIGSLDVSSNPKLWYISVASDHLKSLDVSHNPDLRHLYCSFNGYSSLDVSHNPSLEIFRCSHSFLTGIDVSHNPSLRVLDCQYTDISSLDVSHNPSLAILDCENTNISSLDVSHNPSLTNLFCGDTNISSLDVRYNPSLDVLYCSNTNIGSLDLSQNTLLRTLKCSNTGLSSVDLSGMYFIQELECEQCIHTVNSATNLINLASLPGFNPSRASGWSKGTVSGNLLTVPGSTDVSYTYDCGKGFSAVFTLRITCQSVIEPGKVTKPAISDLKAASKDIRTVIISWKKLQDADGCIILRGGKQIGYSLTESYVDTAANADDFNYYWVIPFSSKDGTLVKGNLSNYVWALGRTVGQVRKVTAKSGKGGISLSWDPASGANGYVILSKSGSNKAAFNAPVRTAGTSYTDTRAASGVTQFYWVYAVYNNAAGKTQAAGRVSPYAWAVAK